jgi:carboxyl-terminal processing protease
MTSTSKKLFLVLAVFAVGFLGGHFVNFPENEIATEIDAESEPENLLENSATVGDLDITTFDQVWRTVEDKFVDVEKLDAQKMFYGAMKGVVAALGDPHSEFLDPEESEEFLDSLEGDITGIGAEIGERDEILTVVSPLRGSPAEAAGLLPGDKIYKIDDEFASDFTVFEAVRKIRGEIGTDVTLTIFRDEEISPREIAITRDFIDIESVYTEMRDDGIAVVTVNTFADDTADEFQKALVDLSLQNPDGIVLDLRFNGGGFLDAAIEMASDLLVGGTVVQIHEREKSDEIIPASGRPILPMVPLVVLINEGSASASEILAGALQDAGRATLLGETSFGKGTVQELISDFADGSTLRITVAKWFTPAGHDVDGIGITPDIVVEFTADDYSSERDSQLAAAVEFLATGKVENSGEEI